MARKPKPINPNAEAKLYFALVNLRQARSFLVHADCPQALEAVRTAIKSAESAHQHARRRALYARAYGEV